MGSCQVPKAVTVPESDCVSQVDNAYADLFSTTCLTLDLENQSWGKESIFFQFLVWSGASYNISILTSIVDSTEVFCLGRAPLVLLGPSSLQWFLIPAPIVSPCWAQYGSPTFHFSRRHKQGKGCLIVLALM